METSKKAWTALCVINAADSKKCVKDASTTEECKTATAAKETCVAEGWIDCSGFKL